MRRPAPIVRDHRKPDDHHARVEGWSDLRHSMPTQRAFLAGRKLRAWLFTPNHSVDVICANGRVTIHVWVHGHLVHSWTPDKED